MMVCMTSERATKSSAERSQTARPSRLTNGFFSLSLYREDRPAAGRMTANEAMANLRRVGLTLRVRKSSREGKPTLFYCAARPVRQSLAQVDDVLQVLTDVD